MTRDEHTTNRPTPGGSAFQETGMDDYLTRVAEAVRDACAEACHKQHTIAERRPIPATICAMHIGHIDLPEVIASVPRPEPVAAQPAVPDGLLTADDMKALRRFIECAEDWDCDGHDVSKEAMKRLERAGAVRSLGFGRHETTAFGDAMLAAAPEAPQTIQCNACDWIGSSADARYLGGRAPLGPLCPECGETTGPADDAAALEAPQPVLDRPASIGGTTFGVGIPVRTLVAAAQRRYEVEQTPASLADRQALIDALRRPAVDAEIAALREQNAALVAAVEATLFHVNNNAATINSSVVCELHDALAIAEGGAA